MTIQAFSRYGAVLFLAAIVAGCSSSNPPASAAQGDARIVVTSSQCEWDRSSCIYKGRYEPGERDYAEDEAKRLNRASLDRLRAMR